MLAAYLCPHTRNILADFWQTARTLWLSFTTTGSDYALYAAVRFTLTR